LVAFVFHYKKVALKGYTFFEDLLPDRISERYTE